MISAEKNDPQATRQALILWSQVLWPDAGATAYEQLHKTADAELRHELENLDQSLYGNEGHSWDGARLSRMISVRKSSVPIKKGAVLPNLYP